MSDDAGVQLRRLINLTVDLPRPKPGASSGQDLLGLDLGGRVTYAHPQGAVPLPNFPEGLKGLQHLVESVPPGVPAGLRVQAWSALLGRPPLQTPLRPLTVERLIGMGIPVSQDSLALYRQVGVAMVARPDRMVRDARGPIAGAAIVTVRLAEKNPHSADSVWVSAAWPTTTRALAHELEHFLDLGAPPARNLKSAAVLIAPELSDGMSDGSGARLQTIGHVFGYHVALYDRSSATFGRIRSELERRSPSLVVSLGAPHSDVAELRDAYRNALPEGNFIAIEPSSAEEAVQQLREHLAALVGVGPGMTVLDPDETVIATKRPPFPFTHAIQCLHDASGRAYVLQTGTSRWWTRDTAGHGDVEFKTYRRESGQLLHDADHDAAGNPVAAKWKSEDGKVIPLTSLHGCKNPNSHLEVE